ncbi:threonine ammonia-lyase [Ornithobacterium rhinotracheale]|uniref:L-threonine dehydratase n=2 Tax=Ornithobacterium rhinotracheale TaxID=28251 RepID=I4A1A8_ORNRL|nr:threonine ammonia-lyase [Ornithobacterium rhinotracheale]AFL97742.1 L-threonine ammonia-lyase [Ornithobacterium rhinotracheale DSM 15997]AIP99586.1 threonine dehydratase [Ornithobacterium rhinotracheale ORT-UMN 88]KGB66585.1 threonine dehydratase [Ornithobacterium rhinotracheale H06-030791]MCK0193959.1 threonine ammonia-lyase [Ornithobacterium rhinotracheale]MCK0205350.1 threonine ammonia-lyase [Ornithobacterium rhinotracheale]
MNFVNQENVAQAAERIQEVIRRTPLDKNLNASATYGANIWYKREDLQTVRSYKIRGAYNKIVQLSPEEKAKGVVCASAGNHAQGVALSCAKLKIKGKIFMPKPTPKQKVNQVKMFGGEWIETVLIGDTFDDSNDAALSEVAASGATYIPPFNDEQIIIGQATIAKEILEQTSEPIDYVILPVGGGGLASGVSSYFKLLSPNTKIIAVEPLGAPSLTKSLEKGEVVELDKIDKFVDGAAVKKIGDLTFSVMKETIDQVLLIDEGQVCVEVLNIYNKDAIVLEPAGALSIAALEHLKDEIKGKNVVCVLSGSNNDITRMEDMKEKALLFQGLKHYFIIDFPQRAGALRDFVNQALGDGVDITYFQYVKRVNRESGPVVLGVELSEKKDLDALIERFDNFDFEYQYLNDNHLLFSTLIN